MNKEGKREQQEAIIRKERGVKERQWTGHKNVNEEEKRLQKKEDKG